MHEVDDEPKYLSNASLAVSRLCRPAADGRRASDISALPAPAGLRFSPRKTVRSGGV